MQYLLNEEEYKELLELRKNADNIPSAKFKKELQKLCTLAADNIPLKSGWMKGNPWGCILTRPKNEFGISMEWYCDDCPAQNVCPYEYKSWSQ